MNKDQIIDEVYEKYHQENKHVMYLTFLLKEEFINKCKTDTEFSEKWGLKIEEKELSLDERTSIFENSEYSKHDNLIKFKDIGELDKVIPTKQITLEYNNEKTYCYE